MRFAAPVVVLLVLLPLPGCERRPAVAPPEIRYGADVCAACAMIISDDRYAAGLVLRRDGRHETQAFDDVGCLLATQASAGAGAVAARYVQAFRGDRWLGADGAVYLHSPKLHSPMAFGVAACASRDEARALREEFPGDILDYAALKRRYDAGELAVRDTASGTTDP